MDKQTLSEKIYSSIRKSGKYSNVYEGTVRKIIDMMITRYGKEKEIEKNVKKKLHQIYGAYQLLVMNYELLVGDGGMLDVEKILSGHVSTAERAGFYEEFYSRIFGVLGSDRKFKIYDAACGYNPFSAGYFMSWVEEYHCSDIDVVLNDNLNRFFRDAGLVNFSSSNKDLTVDQINFADYDVVFLFKTLSCIERQEKGSAALILKNALAAKNVVVSFPSKSIGGREKGMAENYAVFLDGLIEGLELIKIDLTFPNETVYILSKSV
ncbi:MAG: hypothetical protein LCH52_10095 [Bacteroidetes bacterium]|nr:hypothetical protein [Bacteroidota bacterium]